MGLPNLRGGGEILEEAAQGGLQGGWALVPSKKGGSVNCRAVSS